MLLDLKSTLVMAQRDVFIQGQYLIIPCNLWQDINIVFAKAVRTSDVISCVYVTREREAINIDINYVCHNCTYAINSLGLDISSLVIIMLISVGDMPKKMHLGKHDQNTTV